MPSETSKCRSRLASYCNGYGLDIGYGGDSIVYKAINVDLPKPYTNVGSKPLNLGGDARDLYWFKDNVLDFVFSSHLLEDFPPEETEKVLREWLRVLKPGGSLILYLPDEQKYRQYCSRIGEKPNEHHRNANFSLAYIKKLVSTIENTYILYEKDDCEIYSFEIVIKKG